MIEFIAEIARQMQKANDAVRGAPLPIMKDWCEDNGLNLAVIYLQFCINNNLDPFTRPYYATNAALWRYGDVVIELAPPIGVLVEEDE